jgi:acyl carrier protein
MNGLEQELKIKIVQTLGLSDLKPEDIGDEDRLVGGEFGIDSIDVLELVLMVEQSYGVVIDSKEIGEKVFRSVRSLADHIRANGPSPGRTQ